MVANQSDPPRRHAVLRILLRAALIVLLAYLIHLAAGWLLAWTDTLRGGSQIRVGMILLMLLAYAALIAVPFIPGVELGISLMMIMGADVAPFVYLATLGGLSLAYLAGARLPYCVLQRLLSDLRLNKASALIERIAPLDQAARLALLRGRLPARVAPFALRYRHVLLAVLINLPGNTLIGGGGGIALVAGLSRLYAPLPTIATFALAVAPVPVLVWAFDPALAIWLGQGGTFAARAGSQ